MAPPAHYRRLEGSERRVAAGARKIGPADPSEILTVTILVRRRTDAPPLPGETGALHRLPRLSREDFGKFYGASQADLDLVANFATAQGLNVVETNIPRRTVVVSGSVDAMSRAFAVELGRYESANQTYRGREGEIYLPADLVDVVKGVLGLDNRRIGGRNSGDPPNTVGLTVPQVAGLYNFPTNKATGQTIGILEMGGGYLASDIQDFFTNQGAGFTTPTLVDVGIDGASNDGTANGEVTLDICIAGAVAQGAKIAVYFADGSQQGWVDAIHKAVHPGPGDPVPSVLSISWYVCDGDDKTTLQNEGVSTNEVNAIDAAFQDAAILGITVLIASGDTGSDSKVGDGKAHVQFPGSDPWVTSCGGTTIGNVSGSTFTEVVWNDTFFGGSTGATGGGISDFFGLPAYQSHAGVPGSVNDGHEGRGVPDIAANASPNSGYTIWLNGSAFPGGGNGTSAVAPLYAGLIAVYNATLHENVGFLNPRIYPLSGLGAIRDISDGNNNALNGAPGYTAGAGWDACTGLGVINGNALLTALKVSSPVNQSVVAWGANRLDIFGLGTDHAMYHKAWNGSAWLPSQSGWDGLGGIFTSPPAVASWSANRLDIFGLGTDSAMYHKAWNGSAWLPSQSGWEGLGGIFASPQAAVAWGPNRLDIFGLGTDHAMYHKAWNGSAWLPSQTGWEGLGGVFTSPPAGVAWGANRLDIFGLGTDHAMYHKAWNGSAWLPSQTGWEGLGGVFTSPPAVVAWGPNRLDIFGLGTDHAMYHKAWNGSSWLPSQTGWEGLGGIFTSPPAVVAWSENRLDIFGLGTDSAMYHKAWNGSAWLPSQTGWEALGGIFISPPAVVAWSANRLDVFGLGTDRGMYHKAWNGIAWLPSQTGWEGLGGIFTVA
jgi:hypothetical protein